MVGKELIVASEYKCHLDHPTITNSGVIEDRGDTYILMRKATPSSASSIKSSDYTLDAWCRTWGHSLLLMLDAELGVAFSCSKCNCRQRYCSVPQFQLVAVQSYIQRLVRCPASIVSECVGTYTGRWGEAEGTISTSYGHWWYLQREG